MINFKNKFNKFYTYFLVAIKGSETEFTTGSINKAIFLLSVPMILEMIMESLFAVVDVFWVSRISIDAIATVGLTESVMMLVYSIAIGMSMAATALVARRIGEKNPEKAAQVAYHSIIIAFAFSLIITVLGLLYSRDILYLMGGSEELVESGFKYTKWMLGGNLCIMFLFLINGIYRGSGDASMAMQSLWIANGLNIILDPLFIFGIGSFEGYGVEGAAIATTIGRSTGVLYQLYGLFNGKRIIKLSLDNLTIKFKMIQNVLKIASGGMGQFLIESASWIFLVRIISEFGSAALAGYTIAFRIIIFTILPSWGMANAAATLVGQNLGAKKPERAEESVWKTANLNTIFLGLISIIFYLWAYEFVGFFATEKEVLEFGVIALRIICLGYITFAYGMVLSQAFNGAGDTKTPTILNIVFFWLVQIPLAYLLSFTFGLGFNGAMISISVAFALHALACVYLFKLGKWKTIEV